MFMQDFRTGCMYVLIGYGAGPSDRQLILPDMLAALGFLITCGYWFSLCPLSSVIPVF
jgi:hypothetical protein